MYSASSSVLEIDVLEIDVRAPSETARLPIEGAMDGGPMEGGCVGVLSARLPLPASAGQFLALIHI